MPKVLKRNNPLYKILSNIGVKFEDKTKPHPISIYNILTHGTDRRNQLLESHRSPKTGKKWWMQLFIGLYNTMIVNAHKVYCELNKNDPSKHKISHRNFREILLREMYN